MRRKSYKEVSGLSRIQNGYPVSNRWNSKATQELDVKKGGYHAGWRNNQTSL